MPERSTSSITSVTGSDNHVFADSNIVCWERLQKLVPGRHELHVFPGYGHQDPFLGDHVDRDIFPRLLEFIEAHRYDEPQRFGRLAAGVL